MEHGNGSGHGNGNGNGRKAVYTIVEKPGDKSFWLRIGWANVNRDGSFNLTLDALPINGKLHVRDWVPRDRDVDPMREREPMRDLRNDRDGHDARLPPI